MKNLPLMKFAGILAIAAMTFAAGCSPSGESTTAPAETTAGTETSTDVEKPAEEQWVVGVSNTLAGNGWREEMICAVKAEALVSGKVSKVIAISKNGGPTEQIQDLQSLISQGVNAIIVNPADLDKLNPIIEEAEKQGIVVVAVDSPVSSEKAYVAVNDQKEWGRLSAEWLFKTVGGKGNILYMRGIEGVPADTERDEGFQEALADYPDITYKTVWTGWDYTKGGELAVQELSATKYDGVWTSGPDYTVVNALKTAGVDPIPVTGQETNAFIGQLIDGALGAVTTNPAIIGGVGANVAIAALSGEEPERQTVLTPVLLDPENSMDVLKEAFSSERDDLYSATYEIPGMTNFTPEQLVACKGPGE